MQISFKGNNTSRHYGCLYHDTKYLDLVMNCNIVRYNYDSKKYIAMFPIFDSVITIMQPLPTETSVIVINSYDGEI